MTYFLTADFIHFCHTPLFMPRSMLDSSKLQNKKYPKEIKSEPEKFGAG